VGKYTCARVLANRFANSKWVVNFVVVNKMQTTQKVTIQDVTNDMRKNHSIGITKGRAWKAKQIGQKIIDRYVDKKYGIIWRYVVELQRLNSSNTA